VRVQSIEVRVDGSSIGSASCGVSACSLTFNWNARKASAGDHVITAHATDAAGRVASSDPVNVTKSGSTKGGGRGRGKKR